MSACLGGTDCALGAGTSSTGMLGFVGVVAGTDATWTWAAEEEASDA